MKVHPADAHEAEVIANAVDWTAVQMRGRGQRAKAHAGNLEGARQHARAFLAQDPAKPVLIYAVNAAGRQAVVETVRNQ